MSPAFVPSASRCGGLGLRVHLMTTAGEFGTETDHRRWAGLLLIACGAARSLAYGLLRARRRKAEREHAALLEADEAELSEAGRQARRAALHAMRDARRERSR